MRPPCSPPPGTHVDDIVRIANYVQIMLDDNNSCTAFYQSVKDQQKRLHIQRVQIFFQ